MPSWPDMPLWGVTCELRSTGPNLVPVLANRCLYWGVCLTKGQPDPKPDQMSSWPEMHLWGVYLTNLMTYSVEAFKCNLSPQLQINFICLLNYRFTTTATTKRTIYIHTVLSCSIFKNSYPLNNSTHSPALKLLTYLSNGWTWNEQRKLNP